MLDTLPPSKRALLTRIAKLWEQGLTTTVIGQTVGRPKNTICRMVHDARHRGDPRFPARNKGNLKMTDAMIEAEREARQDAYDRQLKELFKVTIPNLPVLTLEFDQCRYPLPDRACPKKRVNDRSPYCAEHRKLCVVSPHK